MAEINELKSASLAVNYELADDFDSDKFIKMRLRVCHDGTNPNGSHFEIEDMNAAGSTLKNIPILANVIYDDDGQPQFGGHDMTIEKDVTKEGEYKTIYKEVPIGVIPETNNYSIEEYDGRNYVFVDGYIWRGYSNYAENIIERDKNIKLSMEINVNEFTYNAKDKVYNITGYKYAGITFLNNNFGTGMKKALATTETFSDNTEQMLMIMQELNTALVAFNKKNSEEGGMEMDTENIATTPAEDIVNDSSTENFEAGNATEANETPTEQPAAPVVEDTEPKEFSKTFKLSHDDIRCGIYSILAVNEEADNDWYYIEEVFDEYFDYSSARENKLFRQKYKVNGDNVEFVEEAFEVFRDTLTADEKAALDAMRANYPTMEAELEELREYKATVETNELNESRKNVIEKWSEQLKNNEAFEALKSTMSDYSVEDLETKCKCIFADSKAVFSFAAKPSVKDDSVVRVPINYELPKVDDVYGGIFSEFGIKNK